jgi:hypothetical protein
VRRGARTECWGARTQGPISDMLSPSLPYVRAPGTIADSSGCHALANPFRMEVDQRTSLSRNPHCHFAPSSPRSGRESSSPRRNYPAGLPSVAAFFRVHRVHWNYPRDGRQTLAYGIETTHANGMSLRLIVTKPTLFPHIGSPDMAPPDTSSPTYVSTSKQIATPSLPKRAALWPRDLASTSSALLSCWLAPIL